MSKKVSDKLLKLESFKRQYRTLLWYSVRSQFENDTATILDNIDINNMLSIASILSKSDDSSHMEMALRIAQTILNYEFSNTVQREASLVVLNNLTNNRTIQLAIEKELVDKDYFNDIPSILQLKSIQNDLKHTVIINGKVVSLNSFQSEVFKTVEANQLVSISSPTSSGKSFILSQILLDKLTMDNVFIIYLVPTRALINQVENDIRELLKNENMKDVYLSTVPKFPEEDFSKAVYVLTQERLHWFLVNEKLKIDMLIVDEAQQVEHGHRGILTEEKLIEVIENNSDVKMIFASPFTKNPEILFEGLPNINNKQYDKVNKDYIAVNQNLLFVTSESGSTKKWKIDLISNIGQIELLKFEFNEPIQEAKRLVKVIERLSNDNGGNLIYQYKPAYTENEALKLFNVIQEEIITDNEKINELIKLVQDTIHPNYNLVQVLRKRIAFHYGNMPLIIRQEIEKLFAQGEIKYIFCTSTLLEGVNLPAKNIFIRKPKRSTNIEMSQTDFWNLAGRAGRLGKEFQGNIICIDVHKWNEEPSIKNKKNEIKRATTVVNEHFDEFLEFIENNTPRKVLALNMVYEYAFNFYYTKWIDNKLDLVLAEETKKEILEHKFSQIHKNITLPKDLLKKHTGISPIAQQELYDFFRSQKRYRNLIPDDIHSDNAVDSFHDIVLHIDEYLSGDPKVLALYHASLIVKWVRGYKLSYIIKDSIKYWKKNDPKKKRDTIIRDVMRDIEEFARFKFAKYSSCYMDLLKLVLIEKKQEYLLEEVPDLTMWLEFGVSEKTQLSFIELGLSRNTAILLSEYCPSAEMTRQACKEWLKEQDLESYELSVILIDEIKQKAL